MFCVSLRVHIKGLRECMHSITHVHKDKISSVYIKGMKEDCEFKFVWINQSPESLINSLSE